MQLMSAAYSEEKFHMTASLYISRRTVYCAAGLMLTALASVYYPSSVNAEAFDIKKLSLEQLMSIDVYSVSRRLEPYQRAPSAIYVLTANEIRRSRVTSVPEALRLVPGVQVARVDANKWAVSIRGFNSRTSNKLLVVVDGRSIYDPLFSGVLWESRDLLIDDIERIEVIRGPGGTLWGANAVNGIINIVTKHTRDTQGSLAILRAGTEERAMGVYRYGWEPNKDQNARVYAKAFERDTGYSPGSDAHDGISSSQAGFRWDWALNSRDDLRISADYYDVTADQRDSPIATQNVPHQGGNLTTRWKRSLADGGTLRAAFNYDHFNLDNTQLGELRDTYEFELQHGFNPMPKHQFNWGVDYRLTSDDLTDGSVLKINPHRRDAVTTGIFVQDTLGLFDEQLNITLGTKFEHNAYTGTEWQPNLRIAWSPDARRTAWASAARAVRVPSRLETDLVFGGIELGKGFDAERLAAYELGYREQYAQDIWYDVSLFYNEYSHLLSIEQNFVFDNRLHGFTYGAELTGRWKPATNMSLNASYSWLEMELRTRSGSVDVTSAPRIEGSSPRHQLVLRGAIDLQTNIELDATLRFVDKLTALDVPSYGELDLGVGWTPQSNLEMSLVGQNLLHSHHQEQLTSAGPVEIQRGAYLKTSWRF